MNRGLDNSTLSQLRSRGLAVFVSADGRLLLRGRVTDELASLAKENGPQILSDLAEEEARQNGQARSWR
jgi:hypothetical protein